MSKPRLTDSELRYFTEVDHHNDEALVAVSRFDGRIVGGARSVRLASEPSTADIAITVVDDWQGHGLGTQLIARLIDHARDEGVTRFAALVADDNVVFAAMLQKFGPDVRIVDRGSGSVEYQIAHHRAAPDATRSWLAAG